jgi:lipopolysaccharide exporter
MDNKSEKFFSSVMKMASGPMVTQILSILLMPIIVRLYSPESFGEFALFGSIVAPIALFSCMGYQTAIMLTKDNESTASIVALSLLFTSVVSIASACILFFITNLYETEILNLGLDPVIWLIPVIIFMHGIFMILRYWNLKNGHFGNIAVANIVLFVGTNSYILGAGFLFGGLGIHLIIAGVVGSLFNIIFLGRRVLDDGLLGLIKCAEWGGVVNIARRYKQFPQYNLFIDLLSRITQYIPIYMFAYFFSQTVVGLYALGLRLLNMPMSLLGNSIGEVFFHRDNKDVSPISGDKVEELFEILALLGALPFVILSLIGDIIFTFAFGDMWSQAGVYVQILSFYIFLRFITLPVNYLVIRMEKQKYLLIFNIILVLIHVVAITIGGLLDNVLVSLGLLSLFAGIAYGVFGFWIMAKIGVNLYNLYISVLRAVFYCLPSIFVVVVSRLYFDLSPIIYIVISFFVATITFFVMIFSEQSLRKPVGILFKKIVSR